MSQPPAAWAVRLGPRPRFRFHSFRFVLRVSSHNSSSPPEEKKRETANIISHSKTPKQQSSCLDPLVLRSTLSLSPALNTSTLVKEEKVERKNPAR
jgi:hypothetical protein